MVISRFESYMPAFKVIRASAGSGKTFSLTREYLIMLFTEHDAFRHILAVTFTNKATEEMKSRIINELYTLANGKPSKQLAGLMGITGFTERQIRSKALVVLKKILHQYSGFHVKTIDSFLQTIIRNFTGELGIQEGYSIELDSEMVLRQAINRLLIKAEKDRELLSWLTLFAESLIEKGESWNLRKGIFAIGKEIFSEPFKELSIDVKKLYADRNYLRKYRQEIFTIFQATGNTYKDFGQKALEIIRKSGLIVDDFANKSRGPAGFLVSLTNGSFKEPTKTALEAASAREKWYTASSPDRDIIAKLAESSLMPLMQEAIAFYNAHCKRYFTSSVILKNLYTIGILSDLSALADEWCAEKNIFLLSEASGFINRIIDGNDTPFIYEKAGFWFHHFMMDEFQDTSMMQWLNFKPLISNSLSQDFDNLAVGDTKQSIYRWRNSNWEILETKIGQDFPSGVTVPISLKENWRSGKNIIDFNNDFFHRAAAILQLEVDTFGGNFQPITNIYRDTAQVPGRETNTGGIVNLEFIEDGKDQTFIDSANKRLLSLIYELLGNGYRLNDIAILTRKNDEAARLAQFLLTHSISDQAKFKLEVISDEALLLSSSIVVNIIIAGFRYIVQPTDRTNIYYLDYLYSAYLKENDSIHNAGESSISEVFTRLVDSNKVFSLPELAEQIIAIFNLGMMSGELAYLMAFRDVINDYTLKMGSNITGFLEYWEEKSGDLAISAPAVQDAIRIVTLHKSKGLEYKITIIPYCNWELNSFNKGYLWCKIHTDPFSKIPVLPLVFNKTLEQTYFAEDFYLEKYKQYVDNLNLLYVAFTRAKEGLFIFCRNGKDDQLKSVSDLARVVLNNTNYHCGSLSPEMPEEPQVGNKVKLNRYVPLDPAERLKIAVQGNFIFDPMVKKPGRPVNEGKLLHEIFNHIKVREDIGQAVLRSHLQGKVTSEEQSRYVSFIEYAMNDIQVSSWFTDDWTIMNETEIILPGGEIKRPDRVMKKGSHTIVIDYKFGGKIEPVYETQIRQYAGILKAMGYPAVEAYIWYVKLGKVVTCKT